MPTNACRCTTCGHTFTRLTFKGDDMPPVCPRCNGRDVNMTVDPEGFMAGTGLGSLLADVPKGPS